MTSGEPAPGAGGVRPSEARPVEDKSFKTPLESPRSDLAKIKEQLNAPGASLNNVKAEYNVVPGEATANERILDNVFKANEEKRLAQEKVESVMRKNGASEEQIANMRKLGESIVNEVKKKTQ